MAVIFTFSRAGFLTLAAMFAIYVWKLRRRRRGAVGVGRAGAWRWPSVPLPAVGIHGSIDDDLRRRVGSHGFIPGAMGRHARRRCASSCATRSIGAGIGQNVLALNAERGPAWKEVHNVVSRVRGRARAARPRPVSAAARLTVCAARCSRNVRRPTSLRAGICSSSRKASRSASSPSAVAGSVPSGRVSVRVLLLRRPGGRHERHRRVARMMASDRIRLLKFSTLFAIGGTERHVMNFVSHLDCSRFDLQLGVPEARWRVPADDRSAAHSAGRSTASTGSTAATR